MTKNITTDTTTWMSIGLFDMDNSSVNTPFSGMFDGKGKTLEFTSNSIQFKKHSTASSYLRSFGVFGCADGTIKNFNVHYSSSSTTISDNYDEMIPPSMIGGVVGHGNIVENCNVIGNLEMTQYAYFGGVVGTATSVKNCSYTGKLKITGGFITGGITGEATTVENCYFAGQINQSGGVYAGGIAARATTIKDCLINADGTIKFSVAISGTNSYAGGIVGICDDKISNCIINMNSNSLSIGAVGEAGYPLYIGYCEKVYNCVVIGNIGSLKSNQNNVGSSNGVYAVTAANASSYKNESTYQNSSKWNSSYPWDFEEIWTIDAEYNSGYPMLKMFCPPTQVNITIDFNVYVDREFVVYMLDKNNNVTNQLVIKNDSKISFTIKTKTTFTLCVYETLYMTCTIDGENTRKKEYTPTADTVISVDISGALNVNNWIVI